MSTAIAPKPDGYVFGRPTKYRPEMCEQVVEWGKLGKSRAWMCSQLDISHTTLLEWEANNEDFAKALTRAEMHAQAHWEDLGHDNITAPVFQGSVWSRSMAARFPKTWREKTEQEVTGKDGTPLIPSVNVTINRS